MCRGSSLKTGPRSLPSVKGVLCVTEGHVPKENATHHAAEAQLWEGFWGQCPTWDCGPQDNIPMVGLGLGGQLNSNIISDRSCAPAAPIPFLSFLRCTTLQRSSGPFPPPFPSTVPPPILEGRRLWQERTESRQVTELALVFLFSRKHLAEQLCQNGRSTRRSLCSE